MTPILIAVIVYLWALGAAGIWALGALARFDDLRNSFDPPAWFILGWPVALPVVTVIALITG